MAMTLWNPWTEFDLLQDRVNKFFEGVRKDGMPSVGSTALPSLDILGNDTEVIVKVAAPGFKPDELQATVSGSTLTVRGERSEKQEKTENNYYWREMSSGSFTRSVSLPAPIDANKAVASFENGILSIHMPRTQIESAKRIEIAAPAGETKQSVEVN